MNEFDYARAWRDLAVPSYNALTDAMRAVWADFARVAGDVKQAPCLDTIGCPPDLRARLEAFSTDELARASRAIYFCGHWDPGIRGGNFTGPFDRFRNGAHWKFSNVCDQILRWRLFGGVDELGRALGNFPLKSYRAMEVHEGMIRETWSTRDSWTWVEVAYASESYLRKRPARPNLLDAGRGVSNKEANASYLRVEAWQARAKAGEFATPDAAPWLDISRFMAPRADYFARENARKKVSAWIQERREAREARYWAERDVLTA